MLRDFQYFHPSIFSRQCLNLLDGQTLQIWQSYLKMRYVIVGQALQQVNLIAFMSWLTDIWSRARMKHPHSQLFRTWFCYAIRGIS